MLVRRSQGKSSSKKFAELTGAATMPSGLKSRSCRHRSHLQQEKHKHQPPFNNNVEFDLGHGPILIGPAPPSESLLKGLKLDEKTIESACNLKTPHHEVPKAVCQVPSKRKKGTSNFISDVPLDFDSCRAKRLRKEPSFRLDSRSGERSGIDAEGKKTTVCSNANVKKGEVEEFLQTGGKSGAMIDIWGMRSKTDGSRALTQSKVGQQKVTLEHLVCKSAKCATELLANRFNGNSRSQEGGDDAELLHAAEIVMVKCEAKRKQAENSSFVPIASSKFQRVDGAAECAGRHNSPKLWQLDGHSSPADMEDCQLFEEYQGVLSEIERDFYLVRQGSKSIVEVVEELESSHCQGERDKWKEVLELDGKWPPNKRRLYKDDGQCKDEKIKGDKHQVEELTDGVRVRERTDASSQHKDRFCKQRLKVVEIDKEEKYTMDQELCKPRNGREEHEVGQTCTKKSSIDSKKRRDGCTLEKLKCDYQNHSNIKCKEGKATESVCRNVKNGEQRLKDQRHQADDKSKERVREKMSTREKEADQADKDKCVRRSDRKLFDASLWYVRNNIVRRKDSKEKVEKEIYKQSAERQCLQGDDQCNHRDEGCLLKSLAYGERIEERDGHGEQNVLDKEDNEKQYCNERANEAKQHNLALQKGSILMPSTTAIILKREHRIKKTGHICMDDVALARTIHIRSPSQTLDSCQAYHPGRIACKATAGGNRTQLAKDRNYHLVTEELTQPKEVQLMDEEVNCWEPQGTERAFNSGKIWFPTLRRDENSSWQEFTGGRLLKCSAMHEQGGKYGGLDCRRFCHTRSGKPLCADELPRPRRYCLSQGSHSNLRPLTMLQSKLASLPNHLSGSSGLPPPFHIDRRAISGPQKNICENSKVPGKSTGYNRRRGGAITRSEAGRLGETWRGRSMQMGAAKLSMGVVRGLGSQYGLPKHGPLLPSRSHLQHIDERQKLVWPAGLAQGLNEAMTVSGWEHAREGSHTQTGNAVPVVASEISILPQSKASHDGKPTSLFPDLHENLQSSNGIGTQDTKDVYETSPRGLPDVMMSCTQGFRLGARTRDRMEKLLRSVHVSMKLASNELYSQYLSLLPASEAKLQRAWSMTSKDEPLGFVDEDLEFEVDSEAQKLVNARNPFRELLPCTSLAGFKEILEFYKRPVREGRIEQSLLGSFFLPVTLSLSGSQGNEEVHSSVSQERLSIPS